MPVPTISIVFPVYNEIDNLRPLLEELEPVLRRLGLDHEILCVDDCSTDGSLDLLLELRKNHPALRVVPHRVNCGESAANATGFNHARAPVIIIMDADLQHDPEDIPRMLAALKPDVAAVCGIRSKREDDWVKRFSSRTANRFRNLLTGDRIADAGCTFRALRRDALGELPVYNGMHRFLPTMLRLQGYKVVEMPIRHRPRTRGQSKYGVGNRLWRGILDCLAMRWYRWRVVPAERVAQYRAHPDEAKP